MSFSDLDRFLMDQALALARQALWLTSPNPRVGCVIARADGTVLGAGHTQRAGQPACRNHGPARCRTNTART